MVTVQIDQTTARETLCALRLAMFQAEIAEQGPQVTQLQKLITALRAAYDAAPKNAAREELNTLAHADFNEFTNNGEDIRDYVITTAQYCLSLLDTYGRDVRTIVGYLTGQKWQQHPTAPHYRAAAAIIADRLAPLRGAL